MQSTKYLLSNRTYLGEARWRDLVRLDTHAPLVEPGLFEAVQTVLGELEERQGQRRRPRALGERAAEPFAYYLRGRVFCGCEARMTTKDAVGRSGPIRYYECPSVSKYGSKECQVQRVNAALLHSVMVGEFARMADHPWRIRRHIERAAQTVPRPDGLVDELKAARRRLAVTNKQVDNLAEAVARGGVSAAVTALVRKMGELEGRREALAAEVLRLEAEVARATAWRPNPEALGETLRLFGQIWERRSDEERSKLFQLIVDRVQMKSRQLAEVTILPAIGEILRVAPRGVGGYGETREDNGTRTHGLESHNLAL